MGIYGDLLNLNQTNKAEVPVSRGAAEVSAPSPTSYVKPAKPKTAKATSPIPPSSLTESITNQQDATVIPRHHGTKQPRYHESIIETIRAAVKDFGKEAATHRFTPEEKKAIADIVYTYRMSGIRTNENELTRIAINFIVTDYKKNGANSILDKVLQSLNA